MATPRLSPEVLQMLARGPLVGATARSLPAPPTPEEERGWLMQIADFISRPSYAVAGAVGAAIEGQDPYWAAWEGLSGQQRRLWTENLAALGAPTWAQYGLGIPAEFVLDPLNLAPVGWVGQGIKALHLPQLARAGALAAGRGLAAVSPSAALAVERGIIKTGSALKTAFKTREDNPLLELTRQQAMSRQGAVGRETQQDLLSLGQSVKQSADPARIAQEIEKGHMGLGPKDLTPAEAKASREMMDYLEQFRQEKLAAGLEAPTLAEHRAEAAAKGMQTRARKTLRTQAAAVARDEGTIAKLERVQGKIADVAEPGELADALSLLNKQVRTALEPVAGTLRQARTLAQGVEQAGEAAATRGAIYAAQRTGGASVTKLERVIDQSLATVTRGLETKQRVSANAAKTLRGSLEQLADLARTDADALRALGRQAGRVEDRLRQTITNVVGIDAPGALEKLVPAAVKAPSLSERLSALRTVAATGIRGQQVALKEMDNLLGQYRRRVAKTQERMESFKRVLDPKLEEYILSLDPEAFAGLPKFARTKGLKTQQKLQGEIRYLPHILTDHGVETFDRLGIPRATVRSAEYSLADPAALQRHLYVEGIDRLPSIDEINDAYRQGTLRRVLPDGTNEPVPAPKPSLLTGEMDPQAKLFEDNPLVILGRVGGRQGRLLASKEYLDIIDRLAVDAVPKAEKHLYTKVKIKAGGETKVRWYPKDVWEARNRFESFNTNPAPIAKLFRQLDGVNQFIRKWSYLPFPASWNRDFMSEAALDWLSGMSPQAIIASRMKAADLMRQNRTGKWSNAVNRQLYQDAVEDRIVGSTSHVSTVMGESGQTIPQTVGGALRGAGELKGNLPVALGAAVKRTTEDVSRLAHYVWKRDELSRTMKTLPDDVRDGLRQLFPDANDHDLLVRWHRHKAQESTWNVHYDYADLTPFERRYLKPNFFFYTWTRKNLPGTLRRMVERPEKLGQIGRLAETSLGVGEDRISQKDIPAWARGEMMLRIPNLDSEENRLLMLLNFVPFGEAQNIAKLGIAPFVASNVAPLTGVAARWAYGTDPFFQAPYGPTKIKLGDREVELPGGKTATPLYRSFRPLSEVLRYMSPSRRQTIEELISQAMLGGTVRAPKRSKAQ